MEEIMAEVIEAKNNVLDMDLTEDQENFLREHLDNWKEEVTANVMEEVEELKEKTIERLEEENIEFKERLKEEYATKMIEALNEMKEEIRAEVIAEMYDDNPELKVLESIKELIAPTLNEDYMSNIYIEELQTLREKVEELEEEKRIDDGAKALAELIAPYSEKTQDILLSLIPEGGPEEVTEKFYEIVEKFEDDEEDYEEESDDDEEDYEEESDDDEEDYEEESDDDEEDYEEDYDEEEYDTYIEEDEEGEEENIQEEKAASIKDRILQTIK
jgi:hypothetical protein